MQLWLVADGRSDEVVPPPIEPIRALQHEGIFIIDKKLNRITHYSRIEVKHKARKKDERETELN